MPPSKPRKRKHVLEENINLKPSIKKLKKLDPSCTENIKENDMNNLKIKDFKKEIFETNLSIPYKDKDISAVITHSNPKIQKDFWVVLTHGAGGDLNVPQLKAFTMFLAAHNFTVLCFTCKGLNIKYRINVFNEVLNFMDAKYSPQKLLIGGRSMGARAAVMLLSNAEFSVNRNLFERILGVLCLSYPLHPIQNVTELRDAPLIALKQPVFFLSGDQDEMCHKSLLEEVLDRLSVPYKVHWLNGYHHSAKSKQEYQESTYINAFKEILNWCKSIEHF